MKRTDCRNANIDRDTFDIIAETFGAVKAESLTPSMIEEIRVSAYRTLSDLIIMFGTDAAKELCGCKANFKDCVIEIASTRF